MGDKKEPPPGGGRSSSVHPSPNDNPVLTSITTTSEMSGGGSEGSPSRMRTFEEIIADEKKNRNIFIVKINKITTVVDGEEVKGKSLNIEDVGELIFDVVKLKVEDCAGLSLTTNRYDTKEINLKPEVDPTPYLISNPIQFKGHEVTITKQRLDTTKVTFKNVPWDIPDEELIHLCKTYGTPINNEVKYEPMPKAYRGIRGPDKTVEVKIAPGKQFENFYWMEGPLEGDKGSRITVLHQGQEQQCSHCLRRSNCPGGGNGKACQLLNTPRAKIADYMKYLKYSHNYTSLKMEYKIKLEKEYPALTRRAVEDDGFGHMVEEETNEAEDINTDPLVNEPQENAPPENLLVNPEEFDYDPISDTIKPRDEKAFDNLVEQHPAVNTLKRGNNRDRKIAGLKAKVLDTLKVVERKKRDLSCESIESECAGWSQDENFRERSLSRGTIRARSDDEGQGKENKKQNREYKNLPIPPKIVISKNQK